MKRPLFFLFALFLFLDQIKAQPHVNTSLVGDGWANNTVNTTIFRKNSLVTFEDIQYIGYYDPDGFLTLGKRKVGDDVWKVEKTLYKGNVKDAHNVISLMVDGSGCLHVAWDHHNNSLRYAQSVSAGSLQLSEKMSMIGENEKRLSYPEFYRLDNGDLLFFYRDGGSGNGNLVINRYLVAEKKWKRVQSNLIDGEGQRNAYWQACVDPKGIIHISWVWRESPDVASNHDIAYACSKDGGVTWENSKKTKYALPITKSSAEYVRLIPQNSELINQTSMSTDEAGNPYIATYWRNSLSNKPQYQLIYRAKEAWQLKTLDFRQTDFSLSGTGTKQIPISRPQVLIKGKGKNASVWLLFRDEERQNKASVLHIPKIKKAFYSISDLTDFSLGSWEPSFDTELWKEQKILHVFIQKTVQKDGEGLVNQAPEPVRVLEWTPHRSYPKNISF